MDIRVTGGGSILLVDDDEELRDATSRLLVTSGYKVEAVRSEESAIEAAVRSPPRLVLLSLEGSSAAATETGRRIRERACLAHDIPIVVFGAEESDARMQFDVASNIHIVHPENFNAIRQFISRLLSAPPPASASE